YQGYGRGLPLDEVRSLSEWATGGLWPDVTVLIDVPAEVAAGRLGPRDRFEAENEAFHGRVREGFAALAAADEASWVIVDGCGPSSHGWPQRPRSKRAARSSCGPPSIPSRPRRRRC